MAAIKNQPAVTTLDTNTDTVTVAFGGGTYAFAQGDFRQMLSEMEGLHLLICQFKLAVANAGLDPLTATWAQIKTAIDGNYKV